ncbi:hypothetical protein [Meridianimarinicoccus sp. MJW13]|uniref:hypothetical protein n=1 Tax=Meridianimarinicoccus sp. MJW13 TaxID=2720031 RepID=UPI0018663E0C|nr:hypothetical protein [Fluviibacterium sp. MJW13]
MDVPTGLLVALMFVTLLTMGFGNILAAFAPKIQAKEPLFIHPLHGLWWAILCLVILGTFWRCAAIFLVENWSFVEFLYMILGAAFLFFASTSLPGNDRPGLSKPFLASLAAFHLWGLGLAVLFGSPGWLPLLVTVGLLGLLVSLWRNPDAPYFPQLSYAVAGLTILSLIV